MDSFGYCQASNAVFTSITTARTLVDSSLPERFKLFGLILCYPERTSFGDDIEYLKLYDGSTSTSPLWIFNSSQGSSTIHLFSASILMQDDSYIPVNDGLYFEVANSRGVSATIPMTISVFY